MFQFDLKVTIAINQNPSVWLFVNHVYIFMQNEMTEVDLQFAKVNLPFDFK